MTDSLSQSSTVAVEKSFLVQRFAKLAFADQQFSLIGYSVAGEETVVQIPELNVCFDVGRAPFFALTSNLLCITHGHMDHVAGIAYYISQRHFQGMGPATILVPRELERPIDNLLQDWRDIERQSVTYKLLPISPGQTYEVRRDFAIRAFATHHGGPSVGYALISVREKLKPEYLGLSGPEIVELRKSGVEIQYKLEVPLVAFLGDTTDGPVFDHPDVINAQVLITETTFFDADHRRKAKAGKHLHVEQLAEILPRLKNQHVVLTHVSRRTGIRRAKHLLRKQIGDAAMQRIHFLMDFDGARDAGDVEATVPEKPE